MRETEEVRDDRKFFKSLICEMFNYCTSEIRKDSGLILMLMSYYNIYN